MFIYKIEGGCSGCALTIPMRCAYKVPDEVIWNVVVAVVLVFDFFFLGKCVDYDDDLDVGDWRLAILLLLLLLLLLVGWLVGWWQWWWWIVFSVVEKSRCNSVVSNCIAFMQYTHSHIHTFHSMYVFHFHIHLYFLLDFWSAIFSSEFLFVIYLSFYFI